MSADIAPSDSAAPATTTTAGPTAADSAENLRIMMEGRVFDRFIATSNVGSPDSPPSTPSVTRVPIFLFYEPSMKLGTFYWCTPGTREKLDEQCIPLSLISDIFLGRQTAELKSQAASGGAADQCFSITSDKRKIALHLRAESASVRSAFLAGIRHVWTKPTMVTQQTPNIAAMAAGANFVSIVRSAAEARAEEKEAVNGTGAVNSGVGGVEKREVFVWYESADSKLGTLYWCDVGNKQRVPGQSLQLHRISDVYLGKQAAEMKSAEASPYPSHCCFSIIAKDKSIHLIAPSEAVRTTWLAGIKDAFANVGKKATDARDSKDRSKPSSADRSKPSSAERASQRGSLAAAAAPAPVLADVSPSLILVPAATVAPVLQPTKPQLIVVPPVDQDSADLASDAFSPRPSPATSAIPPADRPNVLTNPGSALTSPTTAAAVASIHSQMAEAPPKSKISLLEQGQVFTAFVGTSPTVVKSVYVWYDEREGKLGTLYWNDPSEAGVGVKKTYIDQSVPCHRISDVFMGKQTAELKSPEAANYPTQHCFSVVSRDKSLHLAAENEAVRIEFLSNIKQIFLLAGKRVDEERAKLEKRNIALGEGMSSAPLPILSSPYLERGQYFVSYEDDNVVLDKILLWYVNNGDELGYLYWSETGEKVEKEFQRIPVPFISDIYMGKQTPQLDAYTAADAPDNCCFSLVSSDRSLHLKALSPSQRTDFLSALRDLFVLAGKRTQQEAQELAIQQALLANPKRALLMKGGRFIGLFGKAPTERKEVLVWYAPEDGKSGTLYWSANGEREKSSERALPLHRVSDVFMGKQTPELKAEQAKDLPTNRCFSVLTKERGLHLAAADEQQRGDWLSAIKSVFIESGKRVDDEQNRAKAKKEKEAAALLAAQQSTVAPNIQAIEKEAALNQQYYSEQQQQQQGAVVPVDALMEGRDYLAIFPSSLAAEKNTLAYWSRPVFVFCVPGDEDSVGRLYWCDRNSRERIEEQSIPLSKVSDVFLGKHSDAFKSDEGGRYDSKQCVSVVSKSLRDRSLHLVAADEKSKQEFVQSLRAAFSRAAKPGFNVNDPQSIFALMSNGEEVTQYIGSGIIGSSCAAFLWFVQKDGKLGTIYWNEDVKKEKVPGNSLAINHITDVFLGKKTPELLSVEGIFANSDHCLSIMSRKNSVHVAFKSVTVRDAWLQGVKNAYAAGGRIVKESKPGEQAGTRVTTIVSSRRDSAKVSPLLLQGRAFVRYQLVDGRLKKKRIHLWLVPSAGQLGTLYWEDMVAATQKQPMKPMAEQSIPVNKISDVYVGKQTELFANPELASVPTDCCLSIASKEVVLDLAAKYPKDKREWLTAIHSVFVASGKRVVNEEPIVTNIVMDQPVWTPFGEGLAERYPRNDGITAVQLAWAIAYVNHDSLHRLVHVETPLGTGVLLPLDKTQRLEDGTVPVQLQFGVSYVNKRDIRPIKSTSAPASRDVSPRSSITSTPVASTPVNQPVTRSAANIPALSTVKAVTVTSSTAAPREPRKVYTKDEAVSVLCRGMPFTLVSPPVGSNQPRSTLIVAWLAPTDGVLGSLYYNQAGDSSNSGSHSIPVHTITDIYLGNLNFPYTQHADRALSVVGRGETWDLMAESTEQRTAWYYALNALISSSGKDVVSEENPSPNALGLTAHHFHYQKPVEPNYDEATEVLKRGGQFVQHIIDVDTGTRTTQPVFVWYEYDERLGELGALYTTQEEKDEQKSAPAPQSIWRLEDIRDLFLGNRNFRKSTGVRVDNDNCMSVVLRDKSELNLEARNKHQRDQMFYSLVSVLKHGPKVDDEEEAVAADADGAGVVVQREMITQPAAGQVLAPAVLNPVPASQLVSSATNTQTASTAASALPAADSPIPSTSFSSSTTPSSSPSSTPNSTANNLVIDGVVMSVWTGTETQATSSRQLVYWEPPEGKRRLGTLRWCPPDQQQQRIEGQELPLHYISDVFLGRHSPALKSPEAKEQAASQQCFVLVSKNLTFSAQCNSDKEREQWLKAFKRMFTQGGKPVIDQKKTDRRSAGSAAGQQEQSSTVTTSTTATSGTAAQNSGSSSDGGL